MSGKDERERLADSFELAIHAAEGRDALVPMGLAVRILAALREREPREGGLRVWIDSDELDDLQEGIYALAYPSRERAEVFAEGNPVLEFVCVDPEHEPEKQKTYEVWAEGYAVTGSHACANLLGIVQASSWDEAVTSLGLEPNLLKKHGDRWVYWGCRLFANESQARERFG